MRPIICSASVDSICCVQLRRICRAYSVYTWCEFCLIHVFVRQNRIVDRHQLSQGKGKVATLLTERVNMSLQVSCGLPHVPPALCSLSQVRLLNLAGNWGLLSHGGAALAAANLAGLKSCKYLDIDASAKDYEEYSGHPFGLLRDPLRCFSRKAAECAAQT